MARTFQHQVAVDLTGNVRRQAGRYTQAMQRFATQSSRHLGTASRAAAVFGRGIDRLGNRYTALIGGALGAGAARGVINLQRRFTRLGIQANVSAEEVGKLKREIFDAAQAPTIRIDPGEITSAIEKIVEKTGDLKFARENIENIGHAIQATGATGEAVGALISEFQKFGLVTKKDVLIGLDTLVSQGKEGAFTLANLANQGERLSAAYAAAGQTGQEAVQALGALAQVARQGTGGPEQATTALEALFRTLNDPEKRKALGARGIQLVDPDNADQLRSIPAIYEDIVRATRGSAVALAEVFDAEAMRAFNAAAAEFQRTGALPSLEKFLAITGDGKQVIADSARAANDGAGAVQNLSTAWQVFRDNKLAEPIQDIADALNDIEPSRVQQIMKALAIGGAALGGLIVGRKLFQGGRAAVNLFRPGRGGGGPGGGLAGGLAGAAGGVVNVRVTNWPLAMGRGGGAQFGSRGTRAGARGGRLARIGQSLGRRSGLIGGGLLAAASLYDVFTNDDLTTRQKTRQVSGAAGGFAGAAGGAKLGATVGTFGGPLAPFTVPAGALLGGGLGYLFGEKISEALADFFTKEEARKGAADKPTEVKVKLEVSGAGEARVTGVEAGRNSRVNIAQGPIMVGG